MSRKKKNPPEKMYFGIVCTEEEKEKINRQINLARLNGKKSNLTISEFFLQLAGVRGKLF